MSIPNQKQLGFFTAIIRELKSGHFWIEGKKGDLGSAEKKGLILLEKQLLREVSHMLASCKFDQELLQAKRHVFEGIIKDAAFSLKKGWFKDANSLLCSHHLEISAIYDVLLANYFLAQYASSTASEEANQAFKELGDIYQSQLARIIFGKFHCYFGLGEIIKATHQLKYLLRAKKRYRVSMPHFGDAVALETLGNLEKNWDDNAPFLNHLDSIFR